MRFKLVKGSDHVENGKTYKVGQIIETETPLHKIFARTGKFELVRSLSADEGVAEVASPLVSEFGSDVTSLVDAGLLDGGIRVYQKGPWYTVVDTTSNTVLNADKKLKKSQLADFLAQYTEAKLEEVPAEEAGE